MKYLGAALWNQRVEPRRYVCRCPGVSRTVAEVAAMSPAVAQDAGDGEVIALHTCVCGCTLSVPWARQ